MVAWWVAQSLPAQRTRVRICMNAKNVRKKISQVALQIQLDKKVFFFNGSFSLFPHPPEYKMDSVNGSKPDPPPQVEWCLFYRLSITALYYRIFE